MLSVLTDFYLIHRNKPSCDRCLRDRAFPFFVIGGIFPKKCKKLRGIKQQKLVSITVKMQGFKRCDDFKRNQSPSAASTKWFSTLRLSTRTYH